MNGYVIEKMEQYNLRWNHFESTLTGGLHELMQEKSFVDVTLGCENQFIQAHKNILSVCSPYFKTLFNANPCKHPIVILRDVRLTELKALLQFMYRGEVNVNENELPGLLKTADALSIKGLALVSKDLLSKVSLSNSSTSTNVTEATNLQTSEPPRKKTRTQNLPTPPSVSVESHSREDLSTSEIIDVAEIKIETGALEMLDIDPIADSPTVPPHPDTLEAGSSYVASHSTYVNLNTNIQNSEENIISMLRSQKRQIEEMNKQQGVLSQLLQQMQENSSQSGNPVVVPTGNPASAYGVMPVNIVHPESTVRLLGSKIDIPGLHYNDFNRSKYTLFVNDLSTYLFGTETLKRSTLTGKPSRMTRSDRPKQKLDPVKVKAIINQTRHEFPGLSESQIRQSIRAKCNNLNLQTRVTSNGREEVWQNQLAGLSSTDDEGTCD